MPLDVWDYPLDVEPENEVFPPQMVEAVERFAEDHGWEPLDVLCCGVMFFIQRAYDKNTRMGQVFAQVRRQRRAEKAAILN